MIINKEHIESWDTKYRLKFINSLSGYKGVHLIGTKSEDGISNVAIFNSIVHISSEPARIGFIMRPLTVPRDTYLNIVKTKHYTLNHVHESFLEKAHYTSIKSKRDESEFDLCQLTEHQEQDFHPPFVAESKIKLGMKLVEDIPLETSGCRLVIGEVVFVDIEENFIEKDGQIDLEKANNICVTGLNQYSAVKKTKKIPYARVNEVPTFQVEKRPDNIVYDEESQTYNAHLLPYGTTIGSPKIVNSNLSTWKKRGVTAYNHILKSKIDKLRNDYDLLIEDYDTNNLLYSAKYNFEPIIGTVYHLYKKNNDNSSFLSMIPPGAWKKIHLGSYKLSIDKVWIKIKN